MRRNFYYISRTAIECHALRERSHGIVKVGEVSFRRVRHWLSAIPYRDVERLRT